MQCDALGNLAGFVLSPGQRHASVGVAPWIESHATLCDDTAFANDWRRAGAIIPPKAGRARQISGDLDISKRSLQMASYRNGVISLTLLLRS
jgi:hypothetical protein